MGLFDMFSTKSIDSVVDAVIDTGDALVYTDEEKAKANQLKIDTKLAMLKNFEPYKLAQRYIAVTFTINFILAFWIGVVVYFVSPTNFGDYIAMVKEYQLGWIMLAIISFYFTSGAMSWAERIKKK